MSYHPHAYRYKKVSAFVIGDDSIMKEDVGVSTDNRWWLVVVVVIVMVVAALLAKMISRRGRRKKKQAR